MDNSIEELTFKIKKALIQGRFIRVHVWEFWWSEQGQFGHMSCGDIECCAESYNTLDAVVESIIEHAEPIDMEDIKWSIRGIEE